MRTDEMKSSASKIVLDSYESLFGTDTSTDDPDKVRMIPLDELYTFKGHPFRVLDDERMYETTESVRKYGVLVPGIARIRPEGGYEIISGHRRKRACELAGLNEMPMFIRDYSDDEATVVMVDANIQRDDILPSEKAKAYRMKFDALKHRGSRGKHTADEVGEAAGDSATTVKRYIRLSFLSDYLLDLVDEGKITVISGEQLSFLKEEEQKILEDAVRSLLRYPGKAQAVELREHGRAGTLDSQTVYEILGDRKKTRAGIVIPYKRIREFFPSDTGNEEVEEIVIRLLREWKEKQEGGKSK